MQLGLKELSTKLISILKWVVLVPGENGVKLYLNHPTLIIEGCLRSPQQSEKVNKGVKERVHQKLNGN